MKLYTQKLIRWWFIMVFLNFIFGIAGIIVHNLKLKYADDDKIRLNLTKISMIFAACNLVLSVILLVSVLKRGQEYAFVYALVTFLLIFVAIIQIGSNPTTGLTYLLFCVFFALLCLFCLYVYGCCQFWVKDSDMESTESSFVEA